MWIFLFQIWKEYTITTINAWSQCLWTREEEIFCATTYLEKKIIQSYLKIDATH